MIYLEELEEAIKKAGAQNYRTNQIFDHIFKRGILDFKEMKNIPSNLQNNLEQECNILSIKPIQERLSKDKSTEKVLFELSSGEKIEAVLMRFKDGRNSICISTQAGCTMGCKFCATGAMKFRRNLTSDEILDQVLYFYSKLKAEDKEITNIVYMGMGEPFLNYKNTIKSIYVLIDKKYFNIGSRRITVSTCGIIPGIDDFTNESFQVNLAISLHAPYQEIREKIMPASKLYPLNSLLEAIDNYILKTNRRVSFEYIMLKGTNDTTDCAKQLSVISKNKLIHINLIPYNNTKLNNLSGSDNQTISKFKNILQNNNVNVTVRTTMGEDIDAACGQLANKS